MIAEHRIEVLNTTSEAMIGHHNVFTANQVGMMLVVGREFFDKDGKLLPDRVDEVRERIADVVIAATEAEL